MGWWEHFAVFLRSLGDEHVSRGAASLQRMWGKERAREGVVCGLENKTTKGKVFKGQWTVVTCRVRVSQWTLVTCSVQPPYLAKP